MYEKMINGIELKIPSTVIFEDSSCAFEIRSENEFGEVALVSVKQRVNITITMNKLIKKLNKLVCLNA